jgi:hypothetical protein
VSGIAVGFLSIGALILISILGVVAFFIHKRSKSQPSTQPGTIVQVHPNNPGAGPVAMTSTSPPMSRQESACQENQSPGMLPQGSSAPPVQHWQQMYSTTPYPAIDSTFNNQTFNENYGSYNQQNLGQQYYDYNAHDATPSHQQYIHPGNFHTNYAEQNVPINGKLANEARYLADPPTIPQEIGAPTAPYHGNDDNIQARQ